MTPRTSREPTLSSRTARSIADSVDAPPELVPWLGDLFAGVASLGSDNARIVRTLSRLGVGCGDRVVDVGCGKGSLAVLLAEKLGVRTLGVDAYPPFVLEGRRLAREAGVGPRCRFVISDHRRLEKRTFPSGGFDVGLMLGVARWKDARRVLRRLVRPGGIYVLDDACALSGGGYETLRQARPGLESSGDSILEQDLVTPARVRAKERKILRRLARNAEGLAKEHPELERTLRDYLERQREAAGLLAEDFRPVVWFVRRAG